MDLLAILAVFIGLAIVLGMGVAVMSTASTTGCDALSGGATEMVAIITRTPYNVTTTVTLPAPAPTYAGGTSPTGPFNLDVTEQTTESLAYAWVGSIHVDVNNTQVWTRPLPLNGTTLSAHVTLLPTVTTYNMTGLAEGQGILSRIRAFDSNGTQLGQSNSARAYTNTTEQQMQTLYNETITMESRTTTANPWYDKCVEARETSQSGYAILSLILIILAAVGILVAVRQLSG